MIRLMIFAVTLLAFSCGEDDENEDSVTNNLLVGTWEVCNEELDSNGDAISSVSSNLVFNEDGTMVDTLQYFTDIACSVEDGDAIVTNGTYTIGSDNRDHTNIILIYTGIGEGGADVTYYQIFSVSGSNLYMGLTTDVLDSTTVETRPITLESNPYIKQ